jgi:AraC family transcriptional regulator
VIALQSGNYLGTVEKIFNLNGIIASITSYPDTIYAENTHCHETFHMSFVLNGGNLEKRNKYEIERLPGTMTFYDAGEWHQSTKTMAFSKHFNIEIENDFLHRHQIKIDAISLQSMKSPDASFFMLKVLNELRMNDKLSESSILSLLLNFLAITLGQNSYKTMPPWLGVIVEMMQDNWNENISLTDLSAAANVHPVTISKYFPKYFACTIGEYMRKLKIERALHLMRTSKESLAGIAIECGFADQSHFIRAFKQQTGFTPRHYPTIHDC